jgi:hypothetical protein
LDSLDRFAAAAASYRVWARAGADTGAAAARNALLHLVRLYAAALELPPEWSDADEGEPDASEVDQAEWQSVFNAASRIPLRYYGSVFDSSVVPPEEPVVGCLADDLADIYRDVVSGLLAYEQGFRAAARWEWGYCFRTHWGDHATAAIRALHAWLAANQWDGLAAT